MTCPPVSPGMSRPSIGDRRSMVTRLASAVQRVRALVYTADAKGEVMGVLPRVTAGNALPSTAGLYPAWPRP